jgi:hypothetical protein
MSKKINNEQLFSSYLSHVIREASGSSNKLIASFLLEKRFSKDYLNNRILFVTETGNLKVESEINEWIEIYKWISAKKDEFLEEHGADKEKMIILYPSFINNDEYEELQEKELEYLEKKLIIKY